MVVGEYERHIEADGSLRDEEIDRLRTVLDERVDALGVEAVARLVAQIGFGQVRVLVDSPPSRERGPWDPEPSTGSGRGAAELRFFLDYQHFKIMCGRRDGRAHA